MNLGYSKNINRDVDNANCPICGKNIYISKYQNDYACADTNCILGHGAKSLIDKISVILNGLTEDK